MAQKHTIHQLLAALLLLVFIFSITPKKFLHDAIANHKDKTIVVAAGDSPQYSHAAFVCKCDNQVAESPFTDAAGGFSFTALRFFASYQPIETCRSYTNFFLFFQRRGPPALDAI